MKFRNKQKSPCSRDAPLCNTLLDDFSVDYHATVFNIRIKMRE